MRQRTDEVRRLFSHQTEAAPGADCIPAGDDSLMASAIAYSRSPLRAITVSERTADGPEVFAVAFMFGCGASSSSCARYVPAAATEKQARRLRAQRFARRAGDRLCCSGFIALMDSLIW